MPLSSTLIAEALNGIQGKLLSFLLVLNLRKGLLNWDLRVAYSSQTAWMDAEWRSISLEVPYVKLDKSNAESQGLHLFTACCWISLQ